MSVVYVDRGGACRSSTSNAAAPPVTAMDSQSSRTVTLSAEDLSDDFMARVRLFEAAYSGRWAYVKAYLDHNSGWANAPNPLGSQAEYKIVHQAAYHGCGQPVLTMLAAKGCNFRERSKQGTPADIARARGRERCATNIEQILMADGDLNDEGVPDRFLCPITTDFMTDPVAVSSLSSKINIFERSAITNWIRQKLEAGGPVTNPMTGLPLANHDLTPQPELRDEIRAFLTANPSMSDH
mmetsp:Transcript_44066/g.73156  ORF Transcript_44066/g.73156 Transcript_44066/m.73156 type:complete len:239 (-) Transcript_44066:135-851(-)